ncbi:MAG: hypothetical protein Q8P49_00675 [Candidatus Liptonbacteria bacterium]|nr:hypothetical protein [Candidatus Liptonbacteria bacterium]
MTKDYFHLLATECLRWSLSIVYVWFGFLKFFNVSPVFDVVGIAYPIITQSKILYLSLAALEIFIGIGILVPRISAKVLWLLIGHLIVVCLGVVVSGQAFAGNILILSFVGEFILKNVVLMTAALALIAHDTRLQAGLDGA